MYMPSSLLPCRLRGIQTTTFDLAAEEERFKEEVAKVKDTVNQSLEHKRTWQSVALTVYTLSRWGGAPEKCVVASYKHIYSCHTLRVCLGVEGLH